MDPLSAFAVFIAGEVILPDAYSRGVNWALHRDNADRLAQEVAKSTGHRTGRAYRQWYAQEETWTQLVTQGQPAYDALVESLNTALSKRLWGRPDRATVEELVRSTISLFVSSLDPSEAVAVEGHRSATRDAVHDAAEEARHQRTADEVRDVGRRLDAHADLPARVRYLPPAPRRRLLDAPDRDVAYRLLDIVDVENPAAAIAALVQPIPEWLAHASSSVLLAAAELALTYDVPTAVTDLLEHAASLGAERGYCTALLAIRRAEDDPGGALALLKSLPEPRGIHADAVAAILADDLARFDALVPANVAVSDALLAGLRLHRLQTTDASVDDMIAFVQPAVERLPEASALLISLADLHHQRSQQRNAISRAGDRAQARHLFVQARDLRRRWRGDSIEPVAAACRLALAHGDPHRAIALGSEPPRGEAIAREAADSDVRHAVGVAHTALGNIDDAAAAVSAPADRDFPAAILHANVLERAGADSAAVAAAYDAAWALASDELEKRRAWIAAGRAGLVPPPGAEELAQQTPAFQALVAAQAAIATDRPADAVAALRPFPTEELHVTILAHALAEVGDIDDAVAILRGAAERFNDPTEHLSDAVRILRRAGRTAEAADLATEALRVVPTIDIRARAYLHEAEVAGAWQAKAFGEAVRLIRAWIADLGPTPRRRWGLAYALYHAGDTEAAWDVVREVPPLEPSGLDEAQLWVVLAGQHAPGPDTVRRMYDLVERFPGEPEIARLFVGWFLMMGDDARGDVDPIIVARFQELLEQHAVEHDGSSTMSAPIVKITGTAEEMLAKVLPNLEERARALEEIADRVRDGYPYGLLTAVTGRPYVVALVERAAGVYLIASNDAGRLAAEREAARAALESKHVVIDTSTLAIAFHLRGTWPDLRDRLWLEMASAAKQDILRGEDELTDTRAVGSMYFDTSVGAVRGRETDPVSAARVAEHARWIAKQIPYVTVRDGPRHAGAIHEGDDDDVAGPAFQSWMSGMNLAKASGLPLWADDLGLRTLATNEGVTTFGTVALLDVLHDEGVVGDGQLVTLLRTLRQEYAVDLPLDLPWMSMSAAADKWEAGPASAVFFRPASWADFTLTLESWNDIAAAAAADEPAKLISWFSHAAHGLVRAARPGLEHRLVALLAAKATVVVGYDPDVTATILSASRGICGKYGHPDPVPIALTSLHTHLAEAVGVANAAQLLVRASANFAEEDLAALRAVVLGVVWGSSEPASPARLSDGTM